MTEKWWRAGGWGDKEIAEVEVVRSTEKQLVVKIGATIERRHNKVGRWESYFRTYDEAYQWLLGKYLNDVASLNTRLKMAMGTLKRFKREYGGGEEAKIKRRKTK